MFLTYKTKERDNGVINIGTYYVPETKLFFKRR